MYSKRKYDEDRFSGNECSNGGIFQGKIVGSFHSSLEEEYTEESQLLRKHQKEKKRITTWILEIDEKSIEVFDVEV